MTDTSVSLKVGEFYLTRMGNVVTITHAFPYTSSSVSDDSVTLFVSDKNTVYYADGRRFSLMPTDAENIIAHCQFNDSL